MDRLVSFYKSIEMDNSVLIKEINVKKIPLGSIPKGIFFIESNIRT